MKTLGIIAEYNPFHNGHLHHLQESKRLTGAEYVVAVMSGNFTQRGEPAMADKWTRAQMAVDNGVDLVLEIPFAYACNNAEYFAKGAVKILDGLGCVTHLSFGSESGKLDELIMIAKEITNESAEFKESLKKYLDLGLSYPRARQGALEQCLGKEATELIRGSNNILGIEYLKQLDLLNSNIQPVTIGRRGAAYVDPDLSGEMASAMAIRNELEKNADFHGIIGQVPEKTLHILKQINSGVKVKMKDLYPLIAYQILTRSREELSQIFSATEGLENRLKSQIGRSNHMESLLDRMKTKRYPLTRIQRLLIHTLLNLTKDKFSNMEEQGQLYGRVLGFGAKGAELLKSIKKSEFPHIPMITNINKEASQNEAIQSILKYDILASEIYHLIGEGNPTEHSDYVKKPYHTL